MAQTNVDRHLLLAVLKVAREECARGGWDTLEPILAEVWEDLRDAQTPPWAVVSDEIQRVCRDEGVVS
jgi:hypothetical protein